MRYQLAVLALFDRLARNRKDAVSERMNRSLHGSIWIPYAIEVDGNVIRIFDAHCHRPVAERTSIIEYDRRWIEIERPLIIVGGELTLENTDLAFSETARFYEAPFQVKSNGGTLVIDDFGRQRVSPKDLLNRWIPAARAPRRLSNAAQRQKDRGAVRAARRLLDESR
jgi:hypothetical protein